MERSKQAGSGGGRRWAARGLVALMALAWLGSTAWMARYEWFPEFFTHRIEGYRGLLADGPLILDAWMKIAIDGAPAGYSHTTVDTKREGDIDFTVMRNRTVLSINVLGEARRLQISAGAEMDDRYRLQRFEFSLFGRPYQMELEGVRAEGQTFDITVNTGASSQKLRMEIPDDAILYSPMTEMAVRELRPGQSINIRTFDPASMSVDTLTVRAVGEEPFAVDGETVTARVLEADFRGMLMKSWVDDRGRLLRQETPMGWTLESCTAEEALTLKFDGAGADLLSRSAVPVSGLLPAPRTTRTLRLAIDGWPGGPGWSLESSRQRLVAQEEGRIELALRADRLAGQAADPGPPLPPDAVADYLAATPFIQSGHPDLVARAARIVGDAADPVEKARRLAAFVYRHVRKEPSVGVPSALDVLRQGRGDCNEHTYLYVGLARSAGLPSKVVVGLVYSEGALYYHAWPAVYVGGRWVELDPTLNQLEGVDATHVALLEGELKEQLNLLAVIGRLRARVLEETHDPD